MASTRVIQRAKKKNIETNSIHFIFIFLSIANSQIRMPKLMAQSKNVSQTNIQQKSLQFVIAQQNAKQWLCIDAFNIEVYAHTHTRGYILYKLLYQMECKKQFSSFSFSFQIVKCQKHILALAKLRSICFNMQMLMIAGIVSIGFHRLPIYVYSLSLVISVKGKQKKKQHFNLQ